MFPGMQEQRPGQTEGASQRQVDMIGCGRGGEGGVHATRGKRMVIIRGVLNGLLRGKGSERRHQALLQLCHVSRSGSSGHNSSLSRVMQAVSCT